MLSKKEKPVVGIIFDKRGDPPYVSVPKLWKETVDIISSNFTTEIYEVNDFYISSSREYSSFIDKIDLMVMLSPYYSIDRGLKSFPSVFYGLGSMQKGGHWLYQNRASFRSYDSVILNCTACLRIYDNIMRGTGPDPHVIPFGIDTEVFRPRGSRSNVRMRYGIPDDAFLMVYPGRISIQKNCHQLLTVLKNLRDKNKDVYLALVGFFDDFYIPEFSNRQPPESRHIIEGMIEEYGLADYIRFIEHQSDRDAYAEILSSADIGINLTTLISENFGYSQVEMQACGLPVVGADWGGLKDTILDGVTGFHAETVYTRYGVRLNLENAVNDITLLVDDRKKLEEMGFAARNNAAYNYNMQVFSGRICGLIDDTYSKFLDGHKSEDVFEYHPKMENFYRILQEKYRNARHVSWEHLHPSLESDHYRMVVEPCVTKSADKTEWVEQSLLAKGFEWRMESSEKFISMDPRWKTSFELIDFSLSRDELDFLWEMDSGGIRSVSEILSRGNWKWDKLADVLGSLSEKGVLIRLDIKR